jgi:hypothetical protein
MACGSDVNECLQCTQKECKYDRLEKEKTMEKDTAVKKRIDNYVKAAYKKTVKLHTLTKAYIHYADDKGQPMLAVVTVDELKLMFDYLNSDINVFMNDYMALSNDHKKAVRGLVSSLLSAKGE